LKRNKFVALVVLLMLFSTALIAFSGPMDIADVPSSTQFEEPVVDEIPEQVVISPELSAFFTENRGQMDTAWSYYAVGQGLSVAFGDGMFAYRLTEERTGGSLVTVHMVGAEDARPEGVGLLGHPTNFLIGNDPDGWVQGARSYTEVVYEDAWGDIDLGFRLLDGQLKYEMNVPPGEDPEKIKFHYEGVSGLEVDPSTGVLKIKTNSGIISDAAPVSYQDIGGKQIEVTTVYRIEHDDTLGYSTCSFDMEENLVIDPGLEFSTFIGGSNMDVYPDLAVDSSGNSYITGYTMSTDFPTTAGALDSTHNGTSDVYVVKVNPTGSSLVYSTYLGGSGREKGLSICVDESGQAFITGLTASGDFPTTSGAYNTTLQGDGDVFVTKLNSTGNGLVYSTLVGGMYEDQANGISVDSLGQAYVGGITASTDFPIVAGSYDIGFNGNQDAFVFKLNATGGDLNYSTFIGGSAYESANGLALDSRGRAIIVGQTGGSGFPATTGAYDTTHNGDYDVFVTRLDADGKGLSYSTFVGAGNYEDSFDVVVGPDDRVYVVGVAYGAFPTTTGAYDTGANGNEDAILFCLDDDGANIDYSTFIGGTGTEFGYGIDLDTSGNVYITGWTNSGNYPTTSNGYDTTHHTSYEVFLSKLNHNGTALLYSTYFGHLGPEYGLSVQLDSNDTVYLLGQTQSDSFPTTTGAYDTTHNDSDDLFLLKIVVPSPPYIVDQSLGTTTTGEAYEFRVDLTDTYDITRVWVEYWYGDAPSSLTSNLTRISGTIQDGTWNHSIDTPSHSLLPLHYRVFGEDTFGHRNNTRQKTVVISDNDAPEINDTASGPPTTGDQITFWANVTDNTAVDTVDLYYWFGLADDSIKVSMIPVNITASGNGTYVCNITVPSSASNLFHYYIQAVDVFTNWYSSTHWNIIVGDNDPPWLLFDDTDDNATTGDPLKFGINVSDNIDIQSIWVIYQHGSDLANRTNASMTALVTSGLGNGTYTYEFDVPHNSTSPIFYHFEVSDSAGNWNRTSKVRVEVTDNDAPVIVQDLSDTLPTTGDPFQFKVEVTDNIQVMRVYVGYIVDINKDLTILNMTEDQVTPGGNGTYVAFINIPLSTLPRSPYLGFNIVVLDPSMNRAFTTWQQINITDNDPVILGVDLTDTTATTGDPFHFGIHAHDWVGISVVEVVYWFDGQGSVANVTMEEGPRMTRIHDGLTIPGNSTASLHYYFQAWDVSGNWNRTIERVVTVLDNDGSTFGTDDTDQSPVKGKTIEFSIYVLDNIGVDEVYVVYRFGNDAENNDTMIAGNPFTLAVAVPRNPKTPIHYRFVALDLYGNWAETEEGQVDPVNAPPRCDYDEVWVIIEDEETRLDLTAYLTDDNDPVSVLTLSETAQNVTVEGLILVGNYNIWVPDHSFQLTLTDGESASQYTIAISIVNANDAPVFHDKPPNTAQVWTLYSYTPAFFDEDPDDTHTLLLVDKPVGMTIDGDGIIRWTPQRSQHDWNDVLVSLSDGTATVYREWSILVTVPVSEPNNREPLLLNKSREHATAGELYTWQIDMEDPDGDTIRYHLIEAPEGATLDNGTGLLQWTPPYPTEPGSHMDTFRIEATDGVNTVPIEFTVRTRFPVNQAPSIVGTIPDVRTDKRYVMDLSPYTDDPDDPAINLTWSIAGEHDTLFSASIVDGKLVIDPVKGAKGSDTIALVLKDPSGATDDQEIEVRVGSTDDKVSSEFTWWIFLLIISMVVVVALTMMTKVRGGKPEDE